MTELTHDLSLAQARSLIDSYAFDLGRDDTETLLKYWLNLYQASWIRLATIEALYLGRYKAISIEQILNVWLRMGSPNPHFTYEFERLICRKLPKHLSEISQIKVDLDRAERHQATPTASKVVTPSTETKPDLTGSPQLSNQTQAAENGDRAVERSENSDKNLSLISALGLTYRSDWSELTEDRKIHQFMPLPDVSSFFNKLKTFAEES